MKQLGNIDTLQYQINLLDLDVRHVNRRTKLAQLKLWF